MTTDHAWQIAAQDVRRRFARLPAEYREAIRPLVELLTNKPAPADVVRLAKRLQDCSSISRLMDLAVEQGLPAVMLARLEASIREGEV